jgi:hypothetical protein
MLALSQDQVKTSNYTCVEIDGGVKVYWKGLIKNIKGKPMLTLTVSGSNDETKQTPIAIDAFFKFLEVLEINGQKVTGDVCSMNCTGKRKGKDGKGEVVGVKFAEVWMNAATVSQNVSDSLYADFKSLTDNVQDLTSLNDFAIISMLLKCDAILGEIVRRGKLLEDGDEKVELRKVHGNVSQVKKMIEEEKKKRGNIVDNSDPLPF